MSSYDKVLPNLDNFQIRPPMPSTITTAFSEPP